MIHELALLNFRGVREGRLELFPMTVLLGANNSGKTTVLEALYLLYPLGISCLSTYAKREKGEEQGRVLTIAEAIHAYHEILGSRGYRFLIRNYGDGKARIGCRLDGKLKGLALELEEDGVKVYGPYEMAATSALDLMTFVRSKIDEIISERVLGGVEGLTLKEDGSTSYRSSESAKCLFMKPHLANLALEYMRMKWASIRGRGLTGKAADELSKLVNEDYDDLTLEPHIGEGLSLNVILRKSKVGVRLSDMGDGMRMLATAMLLWELSGAELLLWDDVEAFMSPSSLIYISGWMAELVERGAQVIVATHSQEAAKLLVGMAEEFGQEARVVLLALKNGLLRYKVLTLDKLEALEAAGVDVRMAEGFII